MRCFREGVNNRLNCVGRDNVYGCCERDDVVVRRGESYSEEDFGVGKGSVAMRSLLVCD